MGLGVVGEAMGGIRHLTAEPGRVGISLGDTLAALHGVIGIFLALHERKTSGRGPAGSALPGIASSNAYLGKDGG
jgi:formyl-CoA transferase